MTELGKLIETASRANHGRSMQAAADLATSRGCPISKSLISDASRELLTVTPRLIRGIAAGYDISEEDVARAMLADLGVAIENYSPSPESAVRRDPDLSAEARAILLAAIQAARSRAGTVVVRDDPKNFPAGTPAAWRNAPGEKPRVLGDENSENRHEGSR